MTDDTLLTKAGVLHALTFVVAFCSFAYELVYAELLTVVFGGTVTQYGLTVGLFFSSLGVGSFLARALDEERPSNFLRIEFLLALAAPVGFVGILAVTAVDPPVWVPPGTIEVLARLPVVVVGVLSGFELPLLTAMVEREDAAPPSDGLVARARAAVWETGYRAMGLFFHVSRDGDSVDDYSTVLGMDYLSGLAGSLVYVFLLYPLLGLVPTVFVLGLLNGVAALAFVARFSDRWAIPSFRGERRVLRSEEGRAILLACLLLTATYGGVLAQSDRVDSELQSFYFENRIEAEYPEGAVEATVTSTRTTQYQRIVRYQRTWTGTGENPYFANATEQCLRLGTAVQLCESWAEPYHHGLVDVPMTMYENGSDTDVLVLGGGDWIAANHLREYGVSVDQVDLDREFLEYTKNRRFFERHHDNAYEYDRLNLTVGDAWRYLGETDKRYDLILVDLPGAEDDALLRLYSTEFYERLRTHLKPDGVVGAWIYSRYGYSQHHAAYVETVRAAGFDQHVPYSAWNDLDGDGDRERVERFYLLSPDEGPAFDPAAGGAYVRRNADRYRGLAWRPTPSYRGVDPNRVFDPNYDVLIEPRGVNAERQRAWRGWVPW